MIASNQRRRVVVTGVGVINPLGNDIETVWSAVKEGKSGVGYTTIFDASKFPTKISAEIKNWDIANVVDNPDLWKMRGRPSKFAAGAAIQAFNSSGVGDAIKNRRRFGVYMGSGEGNQDFVCFASMMAKSMDAEGNLDMLKFTKAGLEMLNPLQKLEQEPSMPVGHVASLFDAQGPNANCLTACAASSQAIGEATEIIRRGEADVMLSGGTHSMIHPFGVTGFNLLTALSTNNDDPTGASRPFDRLRDGFVLGEGAAMVVLEEYEHAKARGANILGEILGYGSTADAYRVTDIHPEGRGAIGCMNMALNDAGLQPEQIDYVNAHGTSTTVNDKVESKACQEVFGEHAMSTPVSSTKSMMGHLIAAAGATELIICLMAIRDNVLPPTINYANEDPLCPLDYVPNVAREAECNLALTNSFGFGGQNISGVVGGLQ
jgi:3-oxoacyl-[acyl-carrier-protein] synthase II